VLIRDATEAEMEEVGQVRLSAYRAGGHISEASQYAPYLRALGADGNGDVLVAVATGSPDGTILGTVMLQFWPHAGQVVTGPSEAEIRALAVDPVAQSQGVGSALLRAVIERAGARKVRHLVLLTQPGMRAAQRLYVAAGFERLPDRDWSPAPGDTLMAYGMQLADDS